MPREPMGLLAQLSKIRTPHMHDDIVTLAKIAPGTTGDVLLWDASGNPIALADPGKEGRILHSIATGNLVEWGGSTGVNTINFDGPNETISTGALTRHTITYDFSNRGGVSAVLLFFCVAAVGASSAATKGDLEIWRGDVTTGTELENIDTQKFMGAVSDAGSPESSRGGSAFIAFRDTAAPASNPVDYNFHVDPKFGTLSHEYSFAIAIDQGEI